MSDRDYYKKLRKKVKDVMTKARYEHTLGVEFTATSLAMRYGVDIDISTDALQTGRIYKQFNR
jgi:HD superfamily phosphohydrolase YqeK